MPSARLIAVATLLACTGAAHALDFKSIGATPAVLYDAPSLRAARVFVAPRGMPVEIILSYGEWSKVRDAGGDLSWVESKALSPQRTLVVNVANAKIRSSADESASLVFSADKGVLLEMLEPAAAGWVKVKHRDGASGYVKASEVWGE